MKSVARFRNEEDLPTCGRPEGAVRRSCSRQGWRLQEGRVAVSVEKETETPEANGYMKRGLSLQ